ncbi:MULTISPECIES: hypothetical protein [unclassified Bradyrhizobium]|uniref:hypothetical protein n=1 Tax=unclassified Bradyrhizobium TaxID=2631580 RepID=UPI003394DDBB
MGKIVVTIHPNGSLETILKDQVFDTRVFGDRQIERLSEVLPTDDGRSFYVRWLQGPLSETGPLVGFNARECAPGYYSNRCIACWDNGETLYFASYEAAVEYEVMAVNDLRKRGHSFATAEQPKQDIDLAAFVLSSPFLQEPAQ